MRYLAEMTQPDTSHSHRGDADFGFRRVGEDEKTRLVHGFEERARALKGDPTLVGTLSAELKGELQAAVKRFDQAAEANALAIRIARDANQHLLNAIVDAVAAKQAGQNGYGATGAPANPGRCTPKSLSLALDGRV